MSDPFDILVIGGGVNGAGVARDAAGRGYKVALCEMNDLASATSSASTKLIHGGLRYLEYYEFRLVREALQERDALIAIAPHIIWPLRFVLPHHAGLRPMWLLRAGLFLYDRLGGRDRFPDAARIALDRDPRGAALKPKFRRGFEYSDCWVEDSRLVVLNAVDAAERGAEILTRARVVSLAREGLLWRARVEAQGGAREIAARAVVNAAGPWVDDVTRRVDGARAPARFALRLVKGSHIIVDRAFEGEHAYIFQNADGRIVFAIPYEGRFTLIGTTDEPYEGDPGAASISRDEIDYLCAAASEYFRTPITPATVRASYSGVRPLHDDADAKSASAVTRDYVLDIEGAPPMLSIYGGKITTYRRLAEQAMEKLAPALGRRGPQWTADAALPGGDFPDADFSAFLETVIASFPWADRRFLKRIARAYGSRISAILDGARDMRDLGERFGDDFTMREIAHLQRAEFAQTAEDMLWRRSKLALHMSAAEQARLRDRLA